MTESQSGLRSFRAQSVWLGVVNCCLIIAEHVARCDPQVVEMFASPTDYHSGTCIHIHMIELFGVVGRTSLRATGSTHFNVKIKWELMEP